MTGIATNLRVVELTIERLKATGNPDLTEVARVLERNSEFAMMGAIGPTLADFIPSERPPMTGFPRGSQFMRIWLQIFGVVGGSGVPGDPGLLEILRTIRSLLDRLTTIANDEDLGALANMESELPQITAMSEALGNMVGAIPNVAIAVASSIGTGMKPAVLSPGPPPSSVWAIRDYLVWKHPGRFTQALISRAGVTGDERFLAYAYGWAIAYSTNVAGNAFIGSIVGAPYRNQWWRSRWINNFVDAWVHGYYGANATMNGDAPTPAYSAWPNLCDAALHDMLATPGTLDPEDVMRRLRTDDDLPEILPSEFGDFWCAAFADAYGPPPANHPMKPAALNGALVMTWLMLWFQTSGDVIGCNPTPPMAPPDGCGPIPSWSDPTVPGDSGGPAGPPQPSVESDPDEGEIVSGIILALLGLAAVAAGGWIAGAAAIAGGAALIIHGASEINWAKLRCDLHWYKLYLYNGLKALHDILTFGGFEYPYAAALAQDEIVLTLLGVEFRYDSGKRIVKSRNRERYPADPWDGVLASWTKDPTGVEEPSTDNYRTVAYPSFFVADSNSNPVSNGAVVDASATWPAAQDANGARQFGNAVDNAVDLFGRLGEDLPDWNLDSDRGSAWLTWELAATYGEPVQIQPES